MKVKFHYETEVIKELEIPPELEPQMKAFFTPDKDLTEEQVQMVDKLCFGELEKIVQELTNTKAPIWNVEAYEMKG